MSCTGAQRGQLFPGFSSSLYLHLFLESSPKSKHISTNPLIADGISLANLLQTANSQNPHQTFGPCVNVNLRRWIPKSSCRRGQTDWSTSRPWCEGGCKGVQQFIYWHKFGMSSPCLTILCYFDSCHLKENKTAAVIRVRRELSPFLLNNSRVLADLLQPPMPASLMLLRSLPLLLPTCCGQIQLPALFPFQR